MSEVTYTPNAGQTYMPFKDNIHVPTVPFAPLDKPTPVYPEFKLIPEFVERGYIIATQAQHFLPGIEPEMIDWFWANMEKCYYLWAPGSHKRFNWARTPWEYGFVKSAHVISETMAEGLPVFGGNGVQINRLDLSWFPFTECLERVIVEGIFNNKGEFIDSTIHMWEAAPGGTNHVVASVANTRATEPPAFVMEDPGSAPTPEASAGHSEYEAAMWPKFLPTVYRLWDGHPDPTQNVPCDLRVKKVDGKYEYISENGPVKIG